MGKLKENFTITDKYKEIHLNLLQGLDPTSIETMKVAVRTCRTAVSTVKQANRLLRIEDLPEAEKDHWNAVKIICISILSEMTPVVESLVVESISETDSNSYLSAIEVTSQVAIILEDEAQIEANKNKGIEGKPQLSNELLDNLDNIL